SQTREVRAAAPDAGAATALFRANPPVPSPPPPNARLGMALTQASQSAGKSAADPSAILDGLAAFYFARSDLRNAEEFLRRLAEVQRQTLGPSHPALAATLRDLAPPMLSAPPP